MPSRGRVSGADTIGNLRPSASRAHTSRTTSAIMSRNLGSSFTAFARVRVIPTLCAVSAASRSRS